MNCQQRWLKIGNDALLDCERNNRFRNFNEHERLHCCTLTGSGWIVPLVCITSLAKKKGWACAQPHLLRDVKIN